MSCATPLAFATLVDYWAAVPDIAIDAIEDHVFDCDACARRNDAVGQLARGVHIVVGRPGGVGIVATSAIVDRLAGAGLTLRHYRARPGDLVPCTVGSSDDLIVTWLAADLAGTERLDLVVASGDRVLHRFDDVPTDPVTGHVVFLLAGDLARTFPSMTIINTLIAVSGGSERTLAEYTFQHTAFGG